MAWTEEIERARLKKLEKVAKDMKEDMNRMRSLMAAQLNRGAQELSVLGTDSTLFQVNWRDIEDE